jgi:Rrf2 family protein
MKLITRDTDYALRSVCFIAQHDKEVVSVAALVSELNIPKPFLRRLLQQLGRSGVLVSSKGQGGGFRLGKPASKIHLTELMRIFQGPIKINECFLKRSECPNVRVCPLKKKIDELEAGVIKGLSKITVATLLHA